MKSLEEEEEREGEVEIRLNSRNSDRFGQEKS